MPRASSCARIRGPDFEVLAAVARRGVDEAGAGVVGDVIAGEQRHVEVVAAIALERMRADDPREHRRRNVLHLFVSRDARLLEHVGGELVGQDQRVAGLRPVVGGRVGDAIEAVGDLRREADRAIARQRPRRGRPDDDARVPAHEIERERRGVFARAGLQSDARHRKLHPHRIAGVILVLHLGFGERGLLHHAPHHRLASRDRACRSRRTSSARARSAPRPESSSSCRDDPSRPRRRAA